MPLRAIIRMQAAALTDYCKYSLVQVCSKEKKKPMKRSSANCVHSFVDNVRQIHQNATRAFQLLCCIELVAVPLPHNRS